MELNKILASETNNAYKPLDISRVDAQLSEELDKLNKKIIVLDDDPTGVQTVHSISVYTDWTIESIEAGFKEEKPMFFILTNSRSFTVEETEKVHKEIALTVLEVSKRLGKDFIIMSRGDSTLRGHYPLETKVLKDTIEQNSDIKIDGEVIYPFFKEGERFTLNDIHYVKEGDYFVPAGQTEFAKDKTFGYKESHMGKWIEEKSEGEFKEEDTTYISLESIRDMDIDSITDKLLAVKDFNKVIVNSLDYPDVKVFTIALLRAISKGKKFMFRTAAALTKVIGGVPDRGLLTRGELIKEENTNGGMIIVGSHVKKTSEQLEELKNCRFVEFIEFNQHLVLNPPELDKEVERVVKAAQEYIKSGKTVAVYTRRDRLDLNMGDKEEELKIAVRISDSVTSIVQKLEVKPNFIVAKGGITSSDIGTKGLNVKKATVAGQIKPAVPVWVTGEESKFPGMPYIIFPGNVGTKTTLREVVELLNESE